MSQTNTMKKSPKDPWAERIPDTPENVARALFSPPPAQKQGNKKKEKTQMQNE